MSTFKRRDPAQLQAQLQQLKSGNGFTDDKLWKPTVDAAGNGEALIRFLPPTNDDSLPFVKMINHFFKKNGKTYFANCTSTHGDYESCPVCKHLNEHDSFNKNKPEYDLIKRKHQYWANILVIKDPAATENEGKVFKFRFGQKIMDKINAMVEVNVSMGETPIDVFCPEAGANMVLKVKKVSGFPNYDESKFLGSSAIPGIETEAVQAMLTEGMSDLNEIISKDKFDSLEKNTEKFKKVMGTAIMGTAAQTAAAQADLVGDQLSAFDKEMDAFNAGQQDGLDEVFNSTPTNTGAGIGDDLNDILNNLP